MKQISEAAWK